nr:hypothetical protein [Capnocytophaga canimorsus]
MKTEGLTFLLLQGIYKIVWNINENTYTIEKYTWGIIGDGAKGWGDNDDIPLEYDGATNTWKSHRRYLEKRRYQNSDLTRLGQSVGEIKMRTVC